MCSEKNRLFLKKSNVRFFQKQPVFFRKRPAHEKMHIYAVSRITRRCMLQAAW